MLLNTQKQAKPNGLATAKIAREASGARKKKSNLQVEVVACAALEVVDSDLEQFVELVAVLLHFLHVAAERRLVLEVGCDALPRLFQLPHQAEELLLDNHGQKQPKSRADKRQTGTSTRRCQKGKACQLISRSAPRERDLVLVKLGLVGKPSKLAALLHVRFKVGLQLLLLGEQAENVAAVAVRVGKVTPRGKKAGAMWCEQWILVRRCYPRALSMFHNPQPTHTCEQRLQSGSQRDRVALWPPR